MDQLAAIEKGLLEELSRLSREEPSLHSLDDVTEEEALELGRQGARAAFAPLIWGAAIGDRWDVRRATEFLGISRQALYKRVRSGSALGIPAALRGSQSGNSIPNSASCGPLPD